MNDHKDCQPHSPVMRVPPGALYALLAALLLGATPVHADSRSDDPGEGQVRIPVHVYNELLAGAHGRTERDPSAPAPYALGPAEVKIEVGERTARVVAELSVRALEDRWMAVALLPAGSALSAARVDDHAAALVSTASGLSWAVEEAGSYDVQLIYDVDIVRNEGGSALSIPLPRSPSTTLSATFQDPQLEVSVIPSAGLQVQGEGGGTRVSASIPASAGVQLAWQLPSEQGQSVSRIRYRGALERDAVRFVAELDVRVFGKRSVEVPVLPAGVTLADITVDGKPAQIAMDEAGFSTRIGGAGKHRVLATFELPVQRQDGPPHVVLPLLPVPVSQLELSLPGDKEIALDPLGNVSAVRRGERTVSTALLPVAEQVEISWAEAVPEAVDEELLANANIYHLAHAEEGVLYVRAMVVAEVTNGRTHVLDLELPPGVQVSDIASPQGGIKKAIPVRAGSGGQSTRGPDLYRVFLDHELEGTFTFDVYYERKLEAPTDDAGEAAAIEVPLIRAAGMHRQRGMVALLTSKEVTLKPDPARAKNLTPVGENQLPAFVRDAVEKTVAHTYKYLEEPPTLVVQPAPPERREGKFDAQVDTLISLGDVTMKGAATIEVNVKSGSIETLSLGLPAGVNFLSLTAPSLRARKIEPSPQGQRIDVHFTQQMEGQFRLDVAYEKITSEGERDVPVPTLHVDGAEVEQGRIAIEALSAVEVGEAARQHLLPLDPAELPQRLVLKTTNPILRAYKYVQTDPPYALSLAVTRHREVDLQKATIDSADYRTLYTRDGLAVTTVKLRVRNSREQFLRMRLPKGSRVWSAFVAGRPEKLAIQNDDSDGQDAAKDADGKQGTNGARGDESNVLIKIINSTEGFDVELVYETPVDQLGVLGQVKGTLPTPDIVVTQSSWEVYLPHGYRYGSIDSSMEIDEQGTEVSGEEIDARLSEGADRSEAGAAATRASLQIHVPRAGVRYTFSKLYANRAEDPARFSLSYSSGSGARLAQLLALAATLIFWLGLFWLWQGQRRRLALGCAAGGALTLALCLGYFGAGVGLPLLTSGLLLGAGLLRLAQQRLSPRKVASP